jgi:hypothetical protein
MSRTPPSTEAENVAEQPRLERTPTLAVLGIALAARLLVAWIVIIRFPPQWLFSRGMEMGLLAKSLLAGQGLSSPFGPNTGPTAFVAPVYPILVAIVFNIFGPFSRASEIVILAAQIILNLVTIWLVMRIARRLFNQTVATVAGLLWACSLPLIWMPTIFWETSLSCCLLTGLIALVLHLRDQSTQPAIDPVEWMKLGAYCGFAALVNPALVPSLAAIVLWTAFVTRKDSLRKPLLAALTFVLVFAPWPIRNARTFHAFIPTRTTVGFELWMGNHPGSTGFLDESLFPTFNSRELNDYIARGELQYTQHKSDLAWQYIDSHPAAFIRLTATRAARFWAGTGTQHGSPFFAMHAFFTAISGLAGLLLLFRSRRFDLAILFALPLLLFPLPYIITHAEFRYRIVIDPLLTIFAAYAITELYKVAVRHSLISANGISIQPSLASKTPVASQIATQVANQVAWRRS